MWVKKTYRKYSKIIRTLTVLAVYFFVWFTISKVVNQEILIPGPVSVFHSLRRLVFTSFFWVSVAMSIKRILLGFFLAIITGTILAVITVKSKIAEYLLYPAISTIKATPVASFIILALFWFKVGDMPIFICFLMVLPTVWANIREGILNVNKDLIEMSKIYSFSRFSTLRYIFIPSIIPFFRAAFTTGLGMAWKAGVAAEVIGRPDFSIGKELNNAKIYLEMPDMFAWTIIVILISIFLEKLLIWLVNHIGKRYGGYVA